MASQSTQLEETNRLWDRVLSVMKGRLATDQTLETWFRPIQPLRLDPTRVELEAPNSFIVDWIHHHHFADLVAALAEILGEQPEVQLTVRRSREPRAASPPPAPATPPRPRRHEAPRATSLNPRQTFANFVVGSSNRFTHAACRAVAERPGHAYNPLFIFAGTGLGKTHLMHAIGHEIRAGRPDARICYVSAERFTNEMVYAIQHAQTLAFRNKYRSVDLLLIDDVQFLAGKESTQEEFFYTFNALRDAHRQIVVTADKPPKDIPMLEERLTSRFNQGLVTDIEHPDLETRLAILHKRCEDEGGLPPPDDVLLLIADRIRNNIRELEGCLVRLLAVGSLAGRQVTADMVEDVLRNYVKPEPDRITPARVLEAVEQTFGVPCDALVGRRRTQSVVEPRQVAMYLLRTLTPLSLVEIGEVFGGRDHATVIYAFQKVTKRRASEKSFQEKLDALISTLETG